MSLALALAGAQMGVNLLSAYENRRVLRHQVRETVIGGAMERYALEQQGKLDAENRQRYLASVLGAQRAGLAAGGVGGGRTAALLAAQTQAAASRAQAAADQSRRLQTWASERRQAASLRGIRGQARQGALDLFASLLGGSADVKSAWDTRQAGKE